MAYACKILADSVSPNGHRLTSFECTFPRIVLAEVNTHRMLSKSSASSRAIPVAKRMLAVAEDPFIPELFGKNTKGMQHTEVLVEEEAATARTAWWFAINDALRSARSLARLGVHKQLANRVIEPFSWHTAVITATDWSNFFGLRVNPAAQGEFRTIAEMMQTSLAESAPRALNYGEWHLPYVAPDEDFDLEVGGIDPVKVSVARCARVSYLTQDGRRDPAEDVALYERLVGPGHMAPLEHVARPMTKGELDLFESAPLEWGGGLTVWRATGELRYYLGNFNGWVQHRKLIPFENDFSKRPAVTP